MGKIYCTECGAELDESVKFCSSCGAPRDKKVDETSGFGATTPATPGQKSKLTAGLLGIFLGCFGVHNFYLGYNGKAIGQLLLTLLGWILCFTGPFAAWIWGLIEGILILTGSITKDADGNELGE